MMVMMTILFFIAWFLRVLVQIGESSVQTPKHVDPKLKQVYTESFIAWAPSASWLFTQFW